MKYAHLLESEKKKSDRNTTKINTVATHVHIHMHCLCHLLLQVVYLLYPGKSHRPE